jgi:hypothetical protein
MKGADFCHIIYTITFAVFPEYKMRKKFYVKIFKIYHGRIWLIRTFIFRKYIYMYNYLDFSLKKYISVFVAVDIWPIRWVMVSLILTLHYLTTADLQNSRQKRVKYLSDGHVDTNIILWYSCHRQQLLSLMYIISILNFKSIK